MTVAAAQELELPPIDLSIENDIPVGKGFGSSAAALVAGVAIADRVLGLNWDEPPVSKDTRITLPPPCWAL